MKPVLQQKLFPSSSINIPLYSENCQKLEMDHSFNMIQCKATYSYLTLGKCILKVFIYFTEHKDQLSSVFFISPYYHQVIIGGRETWDVINHNFSQENYKISASADGGPRSRVFARETLRSAPIDTSGNFPAHMSAESPSNISPNPPQTCAPKNFR